MVTLLWDAQATANWSGTWGCMAAAGFPHMSLNLTGIAICSVSPDRNGGMSHPLADYNILGPALIPTNTAPFTRQHSVVAVKA